MLQIEIFSDVVCPWCFIGKRRLDRVLEGDLGADVVLRWRPYQLMPNVPLAGVDRDTFLQRRYGDNADAGRVPSRIAEEAQAEGIELRYDLIERTPNTLLAHRLLELAYAQGMQHALADALFVAYFCEGRDVGELETLANIAGSVGMAAKEARAYLAGDGGAAEVRKQLERALEVGVSGVPGYFLAESFLLPGAQSSETMAQIIGRVKSRLAS